MPSSYVESLLRALDIEANEAEERKAREWEEAEANRALDELAALYKLTPNPFHPKPRVKAGSAAEEILPGIVRSSTGKFWDKRNGGLKLISAVEVERLKNGGRKPAVNGAKIRKAKKR